MAGLGTLDLGLGRPSVVGADVSRRRMRRGDVGLEIMAASRWSQRWYWRTAGRSSRLMYAAAILEVFATFTRAGDDVNPLAHTADAGRTRRGTRRDRHCISNRHRLLVRRGDVVPVDGVVGSGLAVLDQSALTGESIPVQHIAGAAIMSGATNAGDAFDLVASRRAAESTYAGIVRLVEAAQRSKAPMSRLADRIALIFLGFTVVIAGGAWLWSGDPIRAVAVLVVPPLSAHSGGAGRNFPASRQKARSSDQAW